MSARELLGVLLVIAGAAVVPLGWIVSHKLLILAAALLGVGGALAYTGRVMRREGASESGTGGPGDIHNYTGWRSGGRTEPLESDGD